METNNCCFFVQSLQFCTKIVHEFSICCCHLPCCLNSVILGCSDLMMNFLTLYLKAECPDLIFSSIFRTDLSCLCISGLRHCCIMDMGKQFPLPSVSWSSVKGNCNLFTVSMISCAICLSTWKLSSFCFTWLSFLLLEQLTDCVQPKMVFWK